MKGGSLCYLFVNRGFIFQGVKETDRSENKNPAGNDMLVSCGVYLQIRMDLFFIA